MRLNRINTSTHNYAGLLTRLWLASLFFCGALLSANASALEFKSVTVPKAVLYDAPSIEAQKLYIVTQGYPVEIIVNLNNWIKIRDHLGALSWIEAKHIGPRRTALVLANVAEIRQTEDAGSALLATLQKDVVVEVVSDNKNGWVKVKHRDGITGFVQNTALWGIN